MDLMPTPTEAGPEAPILVVFVREGGGGSRNSSGSNGDGDGGGGGGAEMSTHTPAAPQVTATVAQRTPDAYDDAFPALGSAKPALAVDDQAVSAIVKLKALERRLAAEATRYSQLQNSVAEELIAQRESGDRRVREVQALMGERIAGLEAEVAGLEGEVAQMRSRCLLLDEMAGKMASLGLVQIANRERDAVAAGSGSGSNTAADESKARDARIAELERVVAKQTLAFEKMQARALKAEMKA